MLGAMSGRVFVSCAPTDMRRGIEGLARIIELEYKDDPFAESSTWAFINRRADKIKLLRWDENGFWLYYKKLARGTFRWRFRDDECVLSLDPRQLSWLLDGLSHEQPQASKPVTQRVMI